MFILKAHSKYNNKKNKTRDTAAIICLQNRDDKIFAEYLVPRYQLKPIAIMDRKGLSKKNKRWY